MATPDKRNVTPPFTHVRFWLFMSLVVIGGSGVIVVAIRELSIPRVQVASLAIVFGLLVVVEIGPFALRGSRWLAGTSYPMMFIFALLLHWGLAGLALACIVQIVTTIMYAFRTRKVFWRSLFNVTQYGLTLGSGYLCLLAFGIEGSIASPAPIDALTLPALLVSGIVALLTNTVLVGTSIALQLGTSWWQEVVVDIHPLAPLHDAASIAMAPLVVLAAERSPWLVPLLLVPLLALHRNDLASSTLKHQADHDALTALPNRACLQERARQALTAGRSASSVVGLFVIDLDRFKVINDTLGHRVGDELLQVIGGRLSNAVRPVDLVARLGGDEFAVLLPDLADGAAAARVATRLISAIEEPMEIEGNLVSIGGSLGIALAPDHGGNFEILMQHADLAMYAAKQRHTSVEMFSAAMKRASSDRSDRATAPHAD